MGDWRLWWGQRERERDEELVVSRKLPFRTSGSLCTLGQLCVCVCGSVWIFVRNIDYINIGVNVEPRPSDPRRSLSVLGGLLITLGLFIMVSSCPALHAPCYSNTLAFTCLSDTVGSSRPLNSAPKLMEFRNRFIPGPAWEADCPNCRKRDLLPSPFSPLLLAFLDPLFIFHLSSVKLVVAPPPKLLKAETLGTIKALAHPSSAVLSGGVECLAVQLNHPEWSGAGRRVECIIIVTLVVRWRGNTPAEINSRNSDE